MEYLIITITAFVASLISFFSGFGLGTILMPIIALFFPLPIAIGLTAIAHLIQNAMRTALLWKNIEWNMAYRFGGISVIAAALGAWTLQKLTFLHPLSTYNFWFIKGEITLLKIIVGTFLILFATFMLIPHKNLKFKNLYLGGAISGFFGGLSGHQGAFRAVFLINAGLDKLAYIATSAAIAVFVDMIRILIYLFTLEPLIQRNSFNILFMALFGAIAGVVYAMFLLKEVTFKAIKDLVIIFLYGIGLLLIAGLI